MNGKKYTMLILGIEMAGSSKNATPKFFPRVAEDLPYKEIRGEGGGPEGLFPEQKCPERCETSRRFKKNELYFSPKSVGKLP